ncbi:hypothetical protein V6N13_008784 [Hibiscus sabdariffa]
MGLEICAKWEKAANLLESVMMQAEWRGDDEGGGDGKGNDAVQLHSLQRWRVTREERKKGQHFRASC